MFDTILKAGCEALDEIANEGYNFPSASPLSVKEKEVKKEALLVKIIPLKIYISLKASTDRKFCQITAF